MKKLGTLELMERALFTEQERELIPLAVLVSHKAEVEKQKSKVGGYDSGSLIHLEAPSGQRFQQLQRGNSTKKSENKKQPSRSELGSRAFLEDEFEELLASEASNEISLEVKEYMIRNLYSIYKGEGDLDKKKLSKKQKSELIHVHLQEERDSLSSDREDPEIRIMGKVYPKTSKGKLREEFSPLTPKTVISQGSSPIKSTGANTNAKDRASARMSGTSQRPSRFRPRERVVSPEM